MTSVTPFLNRVPVVAGPAYRERIGSLPPEFTATLAAEPSNQYHRTAVAVLAGGAKIGYLPPEIARHYHAPLLARGQAAQPAECPGRKAAPEASSLGVLVVLDLTALATPAEP